MGTLEVGTIYMKTAVVGACIVLVSGPALAQGSFYGRWARDQAACSADGIMAPFAVTALTLQWPDTVCAVRRSYRVGDSWHIGAHCVGEGMASNVAIRLTMRGERLILQWPRSRPEELRRCP